MAYARHLSLGQSGEQLATEFLKKHGYKILIQNYKSKLGEIDIIAKDKDTICFIEVKTRRSNTCGYPQEAVSCAKQRKISQAALTYLKEKSLIKKKARFDVVSIISSPGVPEIDLIRNAFELDSGFTY